MPKACQWEGCGNYQFGGGYCKYHQGHRVDSKKPKRIKPIADKRLEALKQYRINRDIYFKENPICEFPDCSSTNITLHHKCGRIGALLTDMRYFCSLCPEHHDWVERNPTESKEMGLSGTRTDK